ncbi:MAG: hypothetical protein ACJ72O_09370 [Marmoricola sp.]
MGEMDMGDLPGTPLEADTTTAEQLSRDERAEQRRAEARAQLEPPTHFSTPSWMGPTTHEYVPPVVPVQQDPVHDQLHVYAPTPVADSVPDSAHWVEHRKPRVFVGVLLALALCGAIASLAFAIINQSVVAVVALVACAIVAVIFRGALMGSGLTTVDLKSSTLRIRKDGELSVFNLADPTHRVEVSGTPGSSDWKVVLESIDHRELTITAAHVNPVDFHRVVTFYREVAEREREDRFNRFNR